MPLVYLALGSNMGDRHRYLDEATALIVELVGQVVATSKRYETEPVGFVSSSLFVNAVLAVDTLLAPMALLTKTQEIERILGRQSKSVAGQYHDRPIDLDILLYADYRYDSPVLTIPHPRMCERRFVLEPLAELAPDLIHPWLRVPVAVLLKAQKTSPTPI